MSSRLESSGPSRIVPLGVAHGNDQAGHYKATSPRNLSLMPIAITAEHEDLADSVRSLVARMVPSEVLHQAMETPTATPPPYWRIRDSTVST